MISPSDAHKEKEALFQFNQNICLSAGAGSGKTSALVRMYLALISGEAASKEPLPLEQIVAITFTEKAAAEMKKRVREALELKLLASKDAPAWKARLQKLERAPITTIHSFCSGIIREHPVEAGVDPAFAVLDDYTSAQRLEKIVKEAVINGLARKDPAAGQLVYDFGFSPAGGVSGLGNFLQDICRQLYASGLGWRELNQLLEENQVRAEECLAINAHRIREGLARLEEAVKGGSVKTSAKSYASIEQLLEYYHRTMDGWGENLTGEGGLFATLESCLTGTWPRAAGTLKKDLLDCCTGMKEAYYQLLSRERLEGFHQLLQEVSQRYQAWKVRQGVLDFDDLLVRTRDMVRGNTGVRKKLKDRFKVIMVDEFQDTNRVQKEIVYYLAEDRGSDYLVGEHEAYDEVLTLHPRTLFVVGDPKQSIYSFRGADVGVFLEVQSHLARKETGGQSLSLCENFRSHQAVVTFCNRFFSFLMEAGTEGYEVAFGEGDHQLCQRTAGDDGTRVELITIGRGQGSEQKRRLEAAAISRRILEMVNVRRSPSVYERDGQGGEKRKPHPDFSDIAILFRRFTHIKTYERELRRRAIPYYLVKGRGFFGCQEIKDIINFLKYLEGESDDIALAGMLRSPLVGISDETLCRLLKDVGEEKRPVTARVLAEHFSSVQSKIADEDSCMISSFLHFFNEIRKQKDSLTPAELIEKTVQATHYDAVMLTTFQGEQKVANVRKLIELSRAFSRKETGLLRDFIAYLLTLAEGDALEAEAQIELENANVVKLMTIHQAKGLEFPIVFLPDTGHAFRQHVDPIVFDASKGIAMKFYRDEKVAHETTLGYREITRLKKSRDYAEAKRLLYVAATRARDYLVVSGEQPDKKGGECWRKWLDQFMASHPDLVHVLPEEQISEELPSDQKNLYQHSAEYKHLGVVPVPHGMSTEARAEKILVQSCFCREHPVAEVHLTVTALSDYMVCPRRFFYLHCLGLDERRSEAGRAAYSGDARRGTSALSDRNRGNIIHFVLKHINLTKDAIHREEEIERLLLRQGVASGGGELELLRGMVLSLLASDLGDAIVSSREEYRARELSFTLRLCDARSPLTAIVQGAIDLLYRDGKGVWTIVDYKYGEGRDMDRKRYRVQLLAYALAVLRCTGEGGVNLISTVMEEPGREPERWHVTGDELKAFEGQVLTCAGEIARGLVSGLSGWGACTEKRDCHFADCGYRVIA